MQAAATQTPSAADTRQRLIDVAVDLFTRHSFAGTSLQMIADEMGFTKAAIYYHFRTREELLAAVVEPIFDQLAGDRRRGLAAQRQRESTTYASRLRRTGGGQPRAGLGTGLRSERDDAAARTAALGAADQQAARTARGRRGGSGGLIKATVALAGISSAVGPAWIAVDDDDLLAASRGHRTAHPRVAQERNSFMKTAVVTRRGRRASVAPSRSASKPMAATSPPSTLHRRTPTSPTPPTSPTASRSTRCSTRFALSSARCPFW